MHAERQSTGRRTHEGRVRVVHPAVVLIGAGALTLTFFLVLPLIQAISESRNSSLLLQSVDTVALPPPPPPPIEQEPEPEEEEEEPPELNEDIQPLDLSQLELALGDGMGSGLSAGDFAIKLNAITGEGGGADALFSMADLDQKPRAIYQPNPAMTVAMRRKAPGTVTVLFVVDEQGRVAEAKVQRSTDKVFERAALDAVKKWKFEPGKRKNKPVRFNMKIPITFPEG